MAWKLWGKKTPVLIGGESHDSGSVHNDYLLLQGCYLCLEADIWALLQDAEDTRCVLRHSG